MIISATLILYNIFASLVGVNLIIIFTEMDYLQYISFLNQIFFFVSLFFYLQLCTSFMMILACAFYQLSAFNNHLKKFIDNPTQLEVSDVIRNTSIMYDKLCDVFDSISAFYMLSILMFILGSTYFNVYFWYLLYSFLAVASKGLGYFLTTTILWCLYYLPCIFWMVMFSSWIEYEGLRTVDLVLLLAYKDTKLKNLKSSITMALQATHRRPKITCGLYELNWKALFAMMGSVFSFSVITIQFYDISNC